MKNTDSVVHVGIVEFGDPTLLIIGDVASMGWLADEIERRVEIDTISDAPKINSRGIRLRIAPSNAGGSLRKVADGFEWEISPEEAKAFSAQLRALGAHGVPGHHYLDPGINRSGFQIVASCGEYDPSIYAA